MRHSIFVTLLCIFATAISAQSREEVLEQYEKNIRREYLNDVYIPADIEEAIEELKQLGDAGAIDRFRSASEEQIARSLHFGLGRWMNVNWNFLEGSRYSHYLKQLGISHPDDMTEFTIVSFHRHLNQRPLEIEERARAFAQMRKQQQEERLKEQGG